MLDDVLDNPSPETTNTEQSLIDSAIELYGQLGTQAVSLNQIRKHAKVQNEAAIRYYFRNKNGLLRRTLQQIAVELKPALEKMAAQLEAASEPKSVREVMLNFGIPFLGIYYARPNSINFIGALIREEGRFGQDLLAEIFGATILRFEEQLERALPEKPQPLIHIHFYLAINNLIHGLGDMSIMQAMPALSEDIKKQANDTSTLVSAFFSYICAGVEHMPSAEDQAFAEGFMTD